MPAVSWLHRRNSAGPHADGSTLMAHVIGAAGFNWRQDGVFVACRKSHISRHSIEESQGCQDYHQNKGEKRAEYDLVHRCAASDRKPKSLQKIVDPLANHSVILLSISSGSRRLAPFVIGLLAVIMLGKSAAFGPLGWCVVRFDVGCYSNVEGFSASKNSLASLSNVSVSKTLHSYLLHLRPLSVSRLRVERAPRASIMRDVNHLETT